jgi:hypothetical protein
VLLSLTAYFLESDLASAKLSAMANSPASLTVLPLR